MGTMVENVKGYRNDGSVILDYRTDEQKELEEKFQAILASHDAFYKSGIGRAIMLKVMRRLKKLKKLMEVVEPKKTVSAKKTVGSGRSEAAKRAWITIRANREKSRRA